MQYNVLVIDSAIHPWGDEGKERYYYNNWMRFLNASDRSEYWSMYQVRIDDLQRGIKVYFDNEGFLHIKNCEIELIKYKISRGMDAWYKWAHDRVLTMCQQKQIEVMDVIRDHVVDLKPGFHQVRCAGKVFNFDDDFLELLDTLEATYYLGIDELHIDSGMPRFDDIFRDLYSEWRNRREPILVNPINPDDMGSFLRYRV